MEVIHSVPPHSLARRDDHGRQSESNLVWGARAHETASAVPGRIEPQGQVVQGRHAGSVWQPGDHEIRAVEELCAGPRHLPLDAVKPPAPFDPASRPVALPEVRGARRRQVEPLVGHEDVFVFGELSRQGRRQFPRVTGKAAARERQGRGVDGHLHEGSSPVARATNVLTRRASATKLAARSRDSKVPASVHQPSRKAKVMVPSRI